LLLSPQLLPRLLPQSVEIVTSLALQAEPKLEEEKQQVLVVNTIDSSQKKIKQDENEDMLAQKLSSQEMVNAIDSSQKVKR